MRAFKKQKKKKKKKIGSTMQKAARAMREALGKSSKFEEAVCDS
jgi:hypothetical protein